MFRQIKRHIQCTFTIDGWKKMIRELKRLATAGNIITSIVLAILIAVSVILTRSVPPVTAAATIIVTIIGVLAWSISKTQSAMKRYPGRRQIAEGDLADYRRIFAATRMQFGEIMIPPHPAQAKPAKTAGDVHLGDASLVLSRSARTRIVKFLRVSNTRNWIFDIFSSRTYKNGASHMLMVTGEPGAGKSVLMQELHTSLSAGVDQQWHSLVPLVVFARDIKSDLAVKASSLQLGITWFLQQYYGQYLLDRKSYSESFASLSRIIGSQWEDCDFLVIFDGLDELADRVNYEKIQRNLNDLITADLKRLRGSGTTHKYILSCRVDENLSVFAGASTVHIPGLSDTSLRTFCDKLIRRAGPEVRDEAMKVLNSKRLVPLHVFRRNPYFLTLLLQYVKARRQFPSSRMAELADDTIDFDYVMREYVKREALARGLTGEGTKLSELEDRASALSEYRDVAQAWLQWLAFYSAHDRPDSLYDEHAVTADMISRFAQSLQKRDEHDDGDWKTAANLVDICSGVVPNTQSPENSSKSPILSNRYQRKLLLELSASAHQAGVIDATFLKTAVEDVITIDSVSRDLYVSICQILSTEYAQCQRSLAHDSAFLLLVRGLAAAHLLRILYFRSENGSTQVRFRHRRLAEYFAACYLRDRWTVEGSRLRFTPWLGPVLNLTTALQGEASLALSWMISHLELDHFDDIYDWRFGVGAVVEAAAFASGGREYDIALGQFSRILVDVLTTHDDLANEMIDANNVVTRMTILSALRRLSFLGEVWNQKGVVDADVANRFALFERDLSAEWLIRGFEARVAIERLAGRRISLGYIFKTGMRGIESPGAALETRVLSSSGAFLVIWGMSLSAVVIGELLYLLGVWTLTDSGFQILASRFGQEAQLSIAKWVAVVFAGLWLVGRGFRYVRSRTSAAKFGAVALWAPLKAVRALRGKWLSPKRVSVAYEATRELLTPETFRAALLWIAMGLLRVAAGIGMVVATSVVMAGVMVLAESIFSGPPESETTITTTVADQPSSVSLPEPLIMEDEVKSLHILLTSPSPSSPPPGLTHDVRLLGGDAVTHERNVLNGYVTRLRTEKAQLRKFISDAENASSSNMGVGRRSELHSAHERFTTDSLLERATVQRFGAVDSVYVIVRSRRNALWFRMIVFAVAACVTVVCAKFLWNAFRDRRRIHQVHRLSNVARLCEILSNSTLSERVRISAINQILKLEVYHERQLASIEHVATTLHRSMSTTDRSIGRRAAELAVILQSRYHHRKSAVSTGSPP
jgi:hypothetical protein